mmetsp:Transcript_26779/g.70360  ORF Transcript_26779/g.70360 Transcript_26779/m.70360 type:complete len:335 (+) Transcript_26779:878-1882(+)
MAPGSLPSSDRRPSSLTLPATWRGPRHRPNLTWSSAPLGAHLPDEIARVWARAFHLGSLTLLLLRRFSVDVPRPVGPWTQRRLLHGEFVPLPLPAASMRKPSPVQMLRWLQWCCRVLLPSPPRFQLMLLAHGPRLHLQPVPRESVWRASGPLGLADELHGMAVWRKQASNPNKDETAKLDPTTHEKGRGHVTCDAVGALPGTASSARSCWERTNGEFHSGRPHVPATKGVLWYQGLTTHVVHASEPVVSTRTHGTATLGVPMEGARSGRDAAPTPPRVSAAVAASVSSRCCGAPSSQGAGERQSCAETRWSWQPSPPSWPIPSWWPPSPPQLTS